MDAFPSRFAAWTAGRARLLLAALAAAVVAGVLAALPAGAPVAPAARVVEGTGDLGLYRAIVGRLETGEAYYPAAADELRERGYALRPALNFRLPTLATLLATLPGALLDRLALAALACAVVAAFWIRLKRSGAGRAPAAAIALVLASGAAIALSPDAVYWHEVWAGLFCALAIATHDPRRWGWSLVFALCAVMLRELALMLPAVMLVLAARERRFTEAAAWLGVIAAFGAVLALHAASAAPHILPTDHANSWAALGGWAFVVSTLQWNLALGSAPYWTGAILLPLALIGLAGWRSPLGERAGLLLLGWVAAFLFIGRPDNSYWGMILSPLLALGAALSVPSLLTLARQARLAPLPTAPARS